MLNVSYSDNTVVFTNQKTNKAETIDLMEDLADSDALSILKGDIAKRDSVSQACVALLSHLMDNPRLDGYKGATPANVQVPRELREAIREIETAYLKPLFCQPMLDKGNKEATVEKQWQLFAGALRAGGSYANVKSRVTAYFAHCGALPKTANGKLLTVAAMDKLIQNAKSALPATPDTGIAGKLVALSNDVESRTEKTNIGDPYTAIAALKSMLATYEGIARDLAEQRTEVATNAEAVTQNLLSKFTLDVTNFDGDDTATLVAIMFNDGDIAEPEMRQKMDELGYDVPAFL